MGCSTLVIADGAADLARREAETLADTYWVDREAYLVERMPVALSLSALALHDGDGRTPARSLMTVSLPEGERGGSRGLPDVAEELDDVRASVVAALLDDLRCDALSRQALVEKNDAAIRRARHRFGAVGQPLDVELHHASTSTVLSSTPRGDGVPAEMWYQAHSCRARKQDEARGSGARKKEPRSFVRTGALRLMLAVTYFPADAVSSAPQA